MKIDKNIIYGVVGVGVLGVGYLAFKKVSANPDFLGGYNLTYGSGGNLPTSPIIKTTSTKNTGNLKGTVNTSIYGDNIDEFTFDRSQLESDISNYLQHGNPQYNAVDLAIQKQIDIAKYGNGSIECSGGVSHLTATVGDMIYKIVPDSKGGLTATNTPVSYGGSDNGYYIGSDGRWYSPND